MLKEFKEFILRGNVIDLAVGVVIGGAFRAIVDSLVKDILMPLIGLLTAGIDFTDMKLVLQAGVMQGEEVITPEIALSYGNLIQAVLNFLLVGICIFFLVKGINSLHRKKEEEAPAPAKSDEVLLLEEIRDSLQAKS